MVSIDSLEQTDEHPSSYKQEYPHSWIMSTDQTAHYIRLPKDMFLEHIHRMKNEGATLACVFATEDFCSEDECTLFYVFEIPAAPRFVVFITSGVSPISIARIFPSASLFEREIADGFGITFEGAFDTRRLFLHECYPAEFHPLNKRVKNEPLLPSLDQKPYQFKEIVGSAVFQVPVGPVHAGIIEPGHFRFSVIGEDIMNLEIRLGFLHRGIEKTSEGKSPDETIKLAESISGDESVVNACGFCQAVEQICNITIPERASYLRGILLELERSYSLLSDLAGMVTDIAHPVSANRLIVLRELLQREAGYLTGSRFMKGSICIGGVSQEYSHSALESLFITAGKVEHELQEVADWALSIPSVLDRFATTGIIRAELVVPLALSGPVARASGFSIDVRVDHPYGIYHHRPPAQVYEPGGDVLARFSLKYQEVMAALRYIQELIVFIPDGPVRCDAMIQDGYALSTLESPRGMTLHWVYIKAGVIHRYKVRTASFCNWYAIEHAVIGNIVPDFPLINKSMNLSYAGTDL